MGEILVLCDESGEDVSFEIIDYIPYRDKTYIALIEEDPDAEEIVILEVEDGEDEEENFNEIEDEEILQAVFDIFLRNKARGKYKEIFY